MKDLALIIRGSQNDTPEFLTPFLEEIGLQPLEWTLNSLNSGNEQLYKIQPRIIVVSFNEQYTKEFESLNKLSQLFPKAITIVLSERDQPQFTPYLHAGAHAAFNSNTLDIPLFKEQIQKLIFGHLIDLQNHKYLINYKSYFDNGPMPMWVVDKQSLRFLEINNASILKYGYPREVFLNLSLHHIKVPMDTKIVQPSSTKKSDYFQDEYECHRRNNGETFYVHMYYHETEFESSKALICLAIDVDEKLQIEKRNEELNLLVKNQKQQLDNILLSLPQAIWSISLANEELTYGNEAFTSIFRLTPELVMSDKYLFLGNILPDDRKLYFKAFKNVQKTGKAEIEFRYRYISGEIRILKSLASLHKGLDGTPDTINGVTIDVTEERFLQAKIKTSEQNLKATINNTKDLIWSVDTKLNIIYCNHPYRDFVFKLSGIIPKQGDYVLADWGSESFLDKRKKDYLRALSGASFTTLVEEEYNGDTMYKEISSNPIINDEGVITGVNCIARDISEQKKQLLHIQNQNEMLREIAWIQSHKVRSPVANILGLVNLVDDCDKEELIYILENLKEASKNLDNIIREVVDKTNFIESNPIKVFQ